MLLAQLNKDLKKILIYTHYTIHTCTSYKKYLKEVKYLESMEICKYVGHVVYCGLALLLNITMVIP